MFSAVLEQVAANGAEARGRAVRTKDRMFGVIKTLKKQAWRNKISAAAVSQALSASNAFVSNLQTDASSLQMELREQQNGSTTGWHSPHSMTIFYEKWATPYMHLAQKMVDEGYYMYSLCQLVRAKLNGGNIKELGVTMVVIR